MEKYILIERDGVINVQQDQPVVTREQFVMLPFVTEAFYSMAQNGYKPIIVTKQQPLQDKMMDQGTLDDIHHSMKQIIHEAGGAIEDILVCPSLYADWERCAYPKPGLLQIAAAKHGFEPKNTYFLCDRLECLQAGWNLGMKTVFVKSGKPFKTVKFLRQSEQQPEMIKRDILSAVVSIFEMGKNAAIG